MSTTTHQPVKAAFREILTMERKMIKQSGNDAYYTLQKELNTLLLEFMRLDFSVLSTKQLLKLCSLVSSHRPCALHTFLIYCSNLSEKETN
jgi:hypothetical protein